MVTLKLKTGTGRAEFLDLPWDQPLTTWPDDRFVSLPAGTHRHVVRFLDLDGQYVALKELPERLAAHEFDMLEQLREEGLPGVTLIGIATDRATADGEPLDDVLLTRHLRYSLPYRSLFSRPSRPELRDRLVDALAVLLVRLHLGGFYWGDCSLNNALFRRDAGALRAYVVDTETAEFRESLSDGLRANEIDIARENVAGGLLDLQAEGLLDDAIDPFDTAAALVDRYGALWDELTAVEELPSHDLGPIHARLARLNDLGFDTEEYELRETDGVVRFRPTVVEEGHHRRVLERLTGITAHENQARRLLSAMRGYGGWLAQTEGEVLPEAVVAYRWLKERFEPTLAAIPADLRRRREDAEQYWEILEHNWQLTEERGSEVVLEDAVADYVEHVVVAQPDEFTVLPE